MNFINPSIVDNSEEPSALIKSFYQSFFTDKNLVPYQAQKQAFSHVFKGDSLMMTVPTGTGKTMVAKAAIYRALSLGQTAIYTTPLRALTEQKYLELCQDFGSEKIGFATGDYHVNPQASIQVVVAEILWGRIFSPHDKKLADVVIMDEGHYFNSFDRGYVWEQSIIALDPRTQLIILSATVGNPQVFCQWVYLTRRIPMHLVASSQRLVPLYHEYREELLLETVKNLFHHGDVPAIVFVFGREWCWETAQLLKSARRFTTDEEQARMRPLLEDGLFNRGAGPKLKSLFLHGIGIHHAGLLPRYKRLVEYLASERLIKFIISTETIAAGINLPAKCVIFPSLRKTIKSKPRLLTAEEYQQMAGRAGRPQFDNQGLAISLAPEEVTLEIRKQEREANQKRQGADINKIRKEIYHRVRQESRKTGNIIWDREVHQRLVTGEPAPLVSHTRITADQILAIGLGDGLAINREINVHTIVHHLLMDDKHKEENHRQLEKLVKNLVALGILDTHGKPITGQMIQYLRGIDGPFVYYVLQHHSPEYELLRSLLEYLVDHDVISNQLQNRSDSKKRDWIYQYWQKKRREDSYFTKKEAEEEYDRRFPVPLAPIAKIHQEFLAALPHPELHGGKKIKTIWASIEDQQLNFMDYVQKESLENEEGNLFSYLARLMRVSRMLQQATTLSVFAEIEQKIKRTLSMVDEHFEMD